MNAVRIPVSAALYEESADYRARVEQVVRRANRFELLAILASDTENDLRFWTHCSAQFQGNPDLFFAPTGHARQALIDAIRSSGANQPVLVGGAVRAVSYTHLKIIAMPLLLGDSPQVHPSSSLDQS